MDHGASRPAGSTLSTNHVRPRHGTYSVPGPSVCLADTGDKQTAKARDISKSQLTGQDQTCRVCVPW
jgi:hypothetical protein